MQILGNWVSIILLDKNNPSTPEGQAFTRLQKIIGNIETELRERGVLIRIDISPVMPRINRKTSEIDSFVRVYEALVGKHISRIIFSNLYGRDGRVMFGEGHTRVDSWDMWGFHNPDRPFLNP